jgi:Rad3-related DNA helicase
VDVPVTVHALNPEWPLFPYTPYPQQLRFMRDVRDCIGRRKVLVVEACNGFGKTASALASLLPLDRRVIYGTRTHEQVRQVLLEVENVNKVAGAAHSAVVLASRRHLCLNDRCSRLSARDAMEACRVLREHGDCPFRTAIGSLSAATQVYSTTRLRGIGKVMGVCPYFLARDLAAKCRVIVAPYPYIFNERIRSLVKLELAGSVLVFDEAHNADQVCQDAMSDTLSDRTLRTAQREVESVAGDGAFLDDLLAFLDGKVASGPVVEPGAALHDALTTVLHVDALEPFVDSYRALVEPIRTHKLRDAASPTCYLNGLLDFLALVASSPRDSYVTVYRTSLSGLALVEYRCLDPSLAIKPVVDAASGALIMSGTLSPIDLYTEILGVDAETRSYAAIANPDHVRTLIDASVTTRFRERSDAMTRRYGARVASVLAEIPNGVLLFFPQRRFMMDALSTWRRVGLLAGPSPGRIAGKPVFVEGAQAADNRAVVRDYKDAAKRDPGAVLSCVFRGRNAEGSNFPDEAARGIVCIGVPYADYSDPVVRAQIRYFDAKRRGMGDRWYLMDAFRAANQAMGRGIRHRDDWCTFVLMDARYASHRQLISRWAVGNGVQSLAR